MRSSKVLVCALAAASVLAGCSSSSARTPATTAVPGYAAPGPHTVGVTTLDLGSAGPVLGERSATVFYPADPSAATAHPRFSYTESETLPAALRGILPARYDDTTTVPGAYDAHPGAAEPHCVEHRRGPSFLPPRSVRRPRDARPWQRRHRRHSCHRRRGVCEESVAPEQQVDEHDAHAGEGGQEGDPAPKHLRAMGEAIIEVGH